MTRPAPIVLVLEPHEASRSGLALILREQGLKVSVAADIAAACALLEQTRFDIVMLDIDAQTSPWALTELRRLQPDAVVVWTSCTPWLHGRAPAHFLEKPIDVGRLNLVLGAVLGR